YERELIARMPSDADAVKRDLGIDEFDGPPELSYYEKVMFQPTLTITGFNTGYTGTGAKSVIPSRAVLKLESRTVPNQTADEIYAKIERHVKQHAPGVSIRKLAGTYPSRTSPELPVSRAIVAAVGEAWGVEPVVTPAIGGSSPNYLFTNVLGIPAIWATYAPADENNHAPNENIRVDDYFKGILASALVYRRVADELATR